MNDIQSGSAPEFPQSYCVVRESRPHIKAPHIVRVRYLTRDGDLDSNFAAANRFYNHPDAVAAAYRHGAIISDSELQYPAPLETKFEVIWCDFSVVREISLAEVIGAETNPVTHAASQAD